MTVAERNATLRSHFGADRGPASLPTLYFALFNGDPIASGVEPDSTGGYARVAKTNDATLWGTITSSAVQVSNAADIAWPAATGVYSQAQLTHFAVYDNSTGGTLWYSGKLTNPIAVSGAGDVPRLPAGSFIVRA